jgi:hypothetical protein
MIEAPHMSEPSTRRRFLAHATALPWCAARLAAAQGDAAPAKSRLDLHVHLMGVGDGGSGCVISPTIQQGPLFKLLVHRLNLRERAKSLDEAYVLALVEQLKGSGLKQCALLAQDAVYDAQGQPDWRKTHVYVPNDYVLQIAASFPELMIPCVSINPARQDALDELDRCVAQGVRILKVHPPIQGVDISEQRHRPFFRRCADKQVIVMVHTGHEHSAPIVDVALANPAKLRQALDEGCTVVACHSGTGRPADLPDMLPEFLKLLGEYKNAGTLWGDTAVLGSLGRKRDFLRLLDDEYAKSRLLHGSDFPFPPVPLEFAPQIGYQQATRLQLESNLLRQDFDLKEAVGIGAASAERAFRLISDHVARTTR